MLWKHILNDFHKRVDEIQEMELHAHDCGYKFFSFKGKIYFLATIDAGDKTDRLQSFDTGIKASELLPVMVADLP